MPADTAWRIILGDGGTAGGEPGPGAAPGAINMAVDAALLEAVRAGAPPVLRLYRWSAPTLSFGRNQPAAGLYDQAAAAARGITFVRRPTGGQAVLHDDELTYAVVAPVAALGKPKVAYRRINEGLVAGLRALGIEAEVAAGRAALAGGSRGSGAAAQARSVDWTAACFRDPAEGEVVVGGRKLVGSAQRCEGRVILQHGSVLVAGSQAVTEELLRESPPGVPADGGMTGWTTVGEELGRRPSWTALADALVGGLGRTLGTALAPAALSVGESTRAGELRALYASRDWTWRR